MNSTAKPTSRELALARRKSLSTKGKPASAGSTQERTRAADGQRPQAAAPAAAPAQAPALTAAAAPRPLVRRSGTAAASPSQQSRAQSRARRSSLAKAGRRAETSTDRTRTADLVRGAKPARCIDADRLRPRATKQIVLSQRIRGYGSAISWSLAKPVGYLPAPDFLADQDN